MMSDGTAAHLEQPRRRASKTSACPSWSLGTRSGNQRVKQRVPQPSAGHRNGVSVVVRWRKVEAASSRLTLDGKRRDAASTLSRRRSFPGASGSGVSVFLPALLQCVREFGRMAFGDFGCAEDKASGTRGEDPDSESLIGGPDVTIEVQ